jgi:hypothetical protein
MKYGHLSMASKRTWLRQSLRPIILASRLANRVQLTNAFSKKVENHAHAVALHMNTTILSASTKRFALPLQWKLELLTVFGILQTLR